MGRALVVLGIVVALAGVERSAHATSCEVGPTFLSPANGELPPNPRIWLFRSASHPIVWAEADGKPVFYRLVITEHGRSDLSVTRIDVTYAGPKPLVIKYLPRNATANATPVVLGSFRIRTAPAEKLSPLKLSAGRFGPRKYGGWIRELKPDTYAPAYRVHVGINESPRQLDRGNTVVVPPRGARRSSKTPPLLDLGPTACSGPVYRLPAWDIKALYFRAVALYPDGRESPWPADSLVVRKDKAKGVLLQPAAEPPPEIPEYFPETAGRDNRATTPRNASPGRDLVKRPWRYAVAGAVSMLVLMCIVLLVLRRFPKTGP